MGLFPYGGTAFPAGNATQVAASLALEHINNRTDVLSGYRLVMDASDTQVGTIHTLETSITNFVW